MNNLKNLFGKRLKLLRKSKGISQEVFAEMININPRNLSRIETGQTFPTTENLEKIINSLECTPSALFDFDAYKSIDEIKQELLSKINSMETAKTILIYKFMKTIE